jgi:hypothetical protein
LRTLMVSGSVWWCLTTPCKEASQPASREEPAALDGCRSTTFFSGQGYLAQHNTALLSTPLLYVCMCVMPCKAHPPVSYAHHDCPKQHANQVVQVPSTAYAIIISGLPARRSRPSLRVQCLVSVDTTPSWPCQLSTLLSSSSAPLFLHIPLPDLCLPTSLPLLLSPPVQGRHSPSMGLPRVLAACCPPTAACSPSTTTCTRSCSGTCSTRAWASTSGGCVLHCFCVVVYSVEHIALWAGGECGSERGEGWGWGQSQKSSAVMSACLSLPGACPWPASAAVQSR